MDSSKKNSDIFFTIGFGLICLVGIMGLLTAALFMLHAPLTDWHFPVSVLLTLATLVYYTGTLKLRDRWGHLLKATGGFLLIIGLSILIAVNVYDLSFDGQNYHQEGVYQMGHNHWNPFFETLPNSVNQAIWVNHYPKQAETSEAAVYALTHKIESGKCLNFILLAASFCLSISFLKTQLRLKSVKAFLLALLFAFNPVTAHQLFTYLVDGQMASLLLCLIIAALFIYKNNSWDKLVILFFTLLACVNIKLTGIVYACLFIGFLLLLLFVNKQMKQFWQVFATAALGMLIAIFFVGYNPYVTNTVKYKNPFYPLLGKNAVDIMTINSPGGFSEKNRFEKIFISYFSHTDNIDTRTPERKPQLKIPFTFNRLDITSLAYPDNRIAGMGALFSGVLVLTLFFAIWLLIYQRQMLLNSYLAGWLLVLVISVIILQEAWMARYVPQLWFIPVFVLILIDPFKQKWLVWLRRFMYGVMLLNIGLSIIVILETNILKTTEINYQLQQLKAGNESLHVNFNGFEANRVRFNEHHIPWVHDRFTDSNAVTVVYSHTQVKVSKPLPALPQPWLMRFIDHLKGKK